MPQIKCLVRLEWVSETPEEIVRQHLLRHMIDHLGYPSHLMMIEKKLNQMPHLRSYPPQDLPDRRFDIVVMAKGIHPSENLYPLILIECKAVPITPKTFRQVIGYNHYLQARFLAVVNQQEAKLIWFDPALNNYRIANGLPRYKEIIERY